MRKNVLLTSTILLSFFGILHVSSAQEWENDLFLRISRDAIDVGGEVSVRISTILEPNSTAAVLVRFLPPQEPVNQYQLTLRADSLGFASETLSYPSDIPAASTQQSGNYTVLVQDLNTGALLKEDSFEVLTTDNLNFISQIPVQILIPLVLAVLGGFFTYLYNTLSAKRETKVTLNQKKAEAFLALRPHYAHVSRSASSLADLTEKLIKAQSTKRVGEQKDNSEQEREKEYKRCFYHLALYVRERNVLVDKFGAYFMSDPRGETLIVRIETNIVNRLRTVLGVIGFDQLGRVLKQGQTLTDLNEELDMHYLRYSLAYELYEKFKRWLENSPNEQIDQFLRDLKLFSNVMMYERVKMFKDWYPRSEGSYNRLNDLRSKIIPVLRWDDRYSSVAPEYLNELLPEYLNG